MHNQFYLCFDRRIDMSYMMVHSTHVGEVWDVQFISKHAKPCLIKWLGEYVSYLIFGAHTLNFYIPFSLMICNEMVAYINVLVLDCWTKLVAILTTLSLSHSNGTCSNLIPFSNKVSHIHSNCAQHLPANMYSTSVIHNATEFCFFEDHDTNDIPRNWHVPDVLFLSTLHPA